MKIRLGDKIVEVNIKDGVPVIQATAEEIKHPDGKIDVVIHVPCLKIQSNKEE